ncbi:MAG: hypothetical protein D6801_00910 [Alphaproteobacteria bacterium]|nr:MAG: hypothetical protein D6801_00910 [Alphaproteobacteria bacterium]
MSTAPHGAAAGQLSLVMFEEAGCVWCARWDAEIGPAYPHTTEAKAAPLERRDIHAPLPETLHLDSPPHFTPTFVLTDDGVEVGRIEGYPGPDFFWPMLDELIARVDPALVN